MHKLTFSMGGACLLTLLVACGGEEEKPKADAVGVSAGGGTGAAVETLGPDVGELAGAGGVATSASGATGTAIAGATGVSAGGTAGAAVTAASGSGGAVNSAGAGMPAGVAGGLPVANAGGAAAGVANAGGAVANGGMAANAGGAVANAGGAVANAGGAVANAGGAAGAMAAEGGAAGAVIEPVTNEEYPLEAGADEDGSSLWLRYPQVVIPGRLAEYQAALTQVVEASGSATLQVAADELVLGLSGLTGMALAIGAEPTVDGAVVLGTPDSSALVAASPLAGRLAALGAEGYLVEAVETDGQKRVIVAANSDVGVLYGAFALLRHLQSHRSLEGLSLSATPKIEHRILNHWDNLDRSVERGYSGRSLWDWNALPGSLSSRYEDYARANASIGINGTVLTNVNADSEVLTPAFLDKVEAIADVFRPYGIAVYLTARFSSPIEIGGQQDADPSNAGVQQWWADKATEIYEKIPDFGGFLVKANSEGQPGPQDYGRSHAEGANMLADAVAPYGGIVMWRAFVYAEDSPADRIKEAYKEFQPLDGQFRENVLVQPKNGPLDFQPREPFSSLFGAMPQTPLALELQITKEYLGQDKHLAYLGTMYEEVLQADTYADGAGSTVARVIDGSLHGYTTTAMAGVANIGSDTNWSGSHFNQANWYVYGRMAWNPDASAEAVAEQWVRQTLSNDPAVVAAATGMMMGSHQALVDYMTPLGLVHIMASTHHYGPGPWVSDLGRAEWNPVYYHKADADGLGFDRTAAGSNAVEQYFGPVRDMFASRDTVPDDLLLFFHHVGWNETLGTGRTLWEELVHRYSLGVDAVGAMRDSWAALEGRIDSERFGDISDALEIQHYEARWWRDSCLQYFKTFANLDIPSGYAEPNNSLSYYQGLSCPSDRDNPRCPDIESGEPSPAILP